MITHAAPRLSSISSNRLSRSLALYIISRSQESTHLLPPLLLQVQMSTLKCGRRRPLPRFEKAARLRVERGKTRFLLQLQLRQTNAKHKSKNMRNCSPDFLHPITRCQMCNHHDIQVKRQACLRRLASHQFRRMNTWIGDALWKRLARLQKIRRERYWAKGFIGRSIALSVEAILTEAGRGKLAGEEVNELDVLD